MTEPDDRDDGPEPSDEDPMRALLKRSLDRASDAGASEPDILGAVQKKIRRRSRGKFYGDGWSTTQTKISYALIAIVMLVLVGVAYFALGPTGFSAR
jgi:hypothetical protein